MMVPNRLHHRQECKWISCLQQHKLHLRSIILNDSDNIGEQRRKWYEKDNFKFYIERADGRYIFQCDSSEECSKWISCLQQHKLHLRSIILNDSDNIGEQRRKWYEKDNFKFYIERADGRYIFQCDSSEECSKWISCLQQHKLDLSPAPPIPPQTSALFLDLSEQFSADVEEQTAFEDSDWDILAQKKWFWGFMNRGDCERKLYSEGKMGDFIIRLNSKQQLIMSLWRDDGIQHHIIVRKGGLYQFQKSSCGSSGESLRDMLETFVVTNQGSINPIGGTLCTLDSDYSWKRKKHAIGTNPPANNYNLVKLKSVAEGNRKFSIQQLPTELSQPMPIDVREYKKKEEVDRKVDISSDHRAPKPKHTQPLCNQQLVSTMPFAHSSPMVCSVPESIKQEDNPQYVNIEPHSLATVASSGDDNVESAEQYENWPAMARLQKDVSSGHNNNAPVYINWQK
jgi:hypothetical protein